MLDVGVVEGGVQSLEPGTHSLWLPSTHTQPEEVDLPGEGRRLSEHPVIVRLRIELAIREHEAAGATESADVGEQVEMMQRDLKSLHAAHREAGHRTMIAIGAGSEIRVDIRNQGLRHVILAG